MAAWDDLCPNLIISVASNHVVEITELWIGREFTKNILQHHLIYLFKFQWLSNDFVFFHYVAR